MCVTYCHRRHVLYWNHEDCTTFTCPVVGSEALNSCASCRHRQGEVCGLTHSPLPSVGGCCHWNVSVSEGYQTVHRAMVEPLGVAPGESLVEILSRTDAVYHLDEDIAKVDPLELGLPEVYGQGTEPVAEVDLWEGNVMSGGDEWLQWNIDEL